VGEGCDQPRRDGKENGARRHKVRRLWLPRPAPLAVPDVLLIRKEGNTFQLKTRSRNFSGLGILHWIHPTTSVLWSRVRLVAIAPTAWPRGCRRPAAASAGQSNPQSLKYFVTGYFTFR